MEPEKEKGNWITRSLGHLKLQFLDEQEVDYLKTWKDKHENFRRPRIQTWGTSNNISNYHANYTTYLHGIN